MYHVLDPIGIPKDPARTSVFVRGFQGVNNLRRKSTTSSSWYRGLRSFGYRGNIFSFRWYSPAEDCRSARCRADRNEEAADALRDLLKKFDDVHLHSTSLMGFSLGRHCNSVCSAAGARRERAVSPCLFLRRRGESASPLGSAAADASITTTGTTFTLSTTPVTADSERHDAHIERRGEHLFARDQRRWKVVDGRLPKRRWKNPHSHQLRH